MNATVVLEVPPSRVWQALLDPALLVRWCCDEAAVEPHPGGRYELSGPRHPAQLLRERKASGVLTRVEPERRLAWTWPIADREQRVEMRLSPQGSGTELVVEQADAPALWPDVRVSDLWIVLLGPLKRLLETGDPGERVDFRQRFLPEVRQEVRVRASPAQVFAVLTEPTGVAQWLSGREGCIELELGGRFDSGWRDPDDDEVQVGPQRVLELEAPRRLAYTWSYPGDPCDSQVTWTLASTASKDAHTQVAVTHGPWPEDYDPIGYVVGWMCCLQNLRGLAERGQVVVRTS